MRSYKPNLLFTMEGSQANHFLASVIASPRGGRINDNNNFRRYRTNVRTTAPLGGNVDSRNAQIFHEVGRAGDRVGSLLASTGESQYQVECSYPTNTFLAEDFLGLAKKYTNFSASFQFSSLGSVAERLAKGLAAYSIFGDAVDSTAMRGNAALQIQALGTYDGPVNSLVNTVFIPRLVNTNMTGDVFSVLANTVAGAGSGIATDVIELDANTRQPLIHTVDGPGFPLACVEALRIVGSNMLACDQGPLFSLAVTRGIHKVLTVVGHTDEGGITRDLLRCGDMPPPFGGIHHGLEPYAGLPALQYNSEVAVAAYVDAIAMTTAAATAHCDPGQVYGGRWFPTVLNGTQSSDPTVRPGDHQDGNAAHANANRAQLLFGQCRFWDNFIPAIAKIFSANGSNDIATRFQVTAGYFLGMQPRHLQFASVSPWFWVEPTGLLPAEFIGTQAERNGSGSLAFKDTCVTKYAWEGLQPYGEKDSTFSAYVADFCSPRRNWFFLHWLNHPMNGLGAIRVRQLEANGVVHPGPCPGNDQVRDRIEADLPFTSYLWNRGQSFICAPGEFMNMAGSVGFLVRHLTFSDDGIPTEEHVPTAREFMDTSVTIEVGRPVGLQVGRSNYGDSGARRARTRALNELAAAKSRAAVFGRSDVAEMPTMATAPRPYAPPNPHYGEGGDNPALGQFTRSRASGPGNSNHERGEPEGTPINATPHHTAVRFPTLPRQGAGAGGGGVAPPPPPPANNSNDDGPDDNEPPAPPAPAAPENPPQNEGGNDA